MRGRRTLPAHPADTFDAAAANREAAEKLRVNAARRRARARGLELRRSSYGYALIDAARQRLDGRSDLSLAEVEARLRDER